MKIEKREKIFISIGIVFLIFYIIFQYIFSPLLEKSGNIEKEITTKEKDLLKMIELRADYNDIIKKKENVFKNLKSKKEDFAIFSYLEKLAIADNLKSNIVHIKPITIHTGKDRIYEQEAVEVFLKSVNLKSLISYLYNIENNHDSIKITQMQMKTQENNQSQLDVNFVVSFFYVKKKGK